MSDSSDENVPRGAWAWWPLRLVVLFVVLIAGYIGCQYGRHVLASQVTGTSKAAVMIAASVLTALAMFFVYELLVRWTEHRSVIELVGRRAVPLVAGGVIIGAFLFCAVCVTLWVLGVAHFLGWGTTDKLAVGLSLALAAAVGEETIMRGVVYRLFEEGFGTTVAVLFSGALFGLLHSANPGATFESSVAIALESGILLASAYAFTRSLWLPIGLHFGWNFTEGSIFGASVSGGASGGLLNTRFAGPDFLTGGAFGPEASLPAVMICLVTAIVMLVLAAERGQWRKLSFRLRSAGAA